MPGPRPIRRPRLLVLLVALTALLGCRTARKDSDTLEFLRGRLVLVISAGDGSVAAAEEADLDRALALVPVRSWPAGADAALVADLDGTAGPTRLEVARREAEERRIPWLLVTEPERLRVEDARGGAVRWERSLRGAARTAPGRARAVRRALGPGPSDGPELIDPDSVRLLDASRLAHLRGLAIGARWEEHEREVAPLKAEFPADPALLVHGALSGLLTDGSSPAADAAIRRAHALNPEGESELLAVALVAGGLGHRPIALRAREHLARAHPTRLDYRSELADLQSEMLGDPEAVRTCLGGLGTVKDPSRFTRLAKGTDPHDAPDALAWADLSFALGWYTARDGRPAEGLGAYEQAMEVYDALGRPRELADTMNNAGVALVQADRAIVAVPMFRRAVRMRAEQGRATKAANSRHNLARALAESQRLEEAIRTYEQAAADYDALGDSFSAAESLYETLEHHASVGDRPALEDRARDLLVRLDGFEEDGPVPRIANEELRGSVWFELGQARMNLDDPKAALEAYDVALRSYRAADRRLYEAQTLYSMAVPNIALFRLQEAHANLLAAFELAVELSDSASIIDIRDQVAELRHLIEASGEEPGEIPPSLLPFMNEP